MRIEITPVERGRLPLGVVAGGVMLLAALAAWGWIAMEAPVPGCALREWTGVACPTCGSTRLVRSALRGDLGSAFLASPLVFLTLAGVGVWSVASTFCRFVARRGCRVILGRGERVALRVAVVVTLLAGWTWVIARYAR